MRYLRYIALLSLLTFYQITSASEHLTRASDFNDKIQNLKAAAKKKGKIPIIIKLNVKFTPEGYLTSARLTQQKWAIKSASFSVTSTLRKINKNFKIVEFNILPYIATEVDEKAIELIIKNPNVLSIDENGSSKNSLDLSIPLINGNTAFAQGYSGQGQTVAVIDTGVKTEHEFFSGKIVSQACFSSAGGTVGTSLCPNGAASSYLIGSAEDCSSTIAGCGHGTHVAGIAVGKNSQISGVAKDAKLIAIKAATQIGNATFYQDSDIAKALLRVYALRTQFQIASVNLSINHSARLSSNNCDSTVQSVTDAVDLLKSVNIATIISSGNQGQKNQMAWPACISNAVSVGNTVSELQANQPNYPVNSIWIDSNISATTDLLAPGTKINSSTFTSNTSYGEDWGTSMAAPHVAGAFAVLRSKNPNASVDTLLTALKTSGLNVTDQRSGGVYTKPRIDVANALALVTNTPNSFQAITPINTTTGVKPTFTWTPLPGQTNYWVVADDSPTLTWPYAVYNTISAAAANCSSGVCSYTSTTNFAPGTAVWKIQAPQTSGAWPETSLLNFTVN